MDEGSSTQAFAIAGPDLCDFPRDARKRPEVQGVRVTHATLPVNQRITGQTNVTAKCTVIGEGSPCAVAAPVGTTLSVEPDGGGDGSADKDIPPPQQKFSRRLG